MNLGYSDVYVRDGNTGQLVPGKLYNSITAKHIDDHEHFWRPVIESLSTEHGHWNWRKKLAYYRKQLSSETFALECSGMTQGMMIVNTMNRCRIAGQRNKHLVYVEYLETAPWNLKSAPAGPKFKGVGLVLIAAAIQLSIEEGNNGRIGLHSLPQSDAFYEKCGMTDLGEDASYPGYPLRYFEMTDSQAPRFLASE